MLATTAGDDRRTVLLAISGDLGAFNVLVARHQSYLRALLNKSCGDPALADDLAQVAFLKAWDQLHSLRDPGSFRPWLRRIALNALIDASRRSTGIVEKWDDDADTGLQPPRCSIEERVDLDRALSLLSIPQRTCIVLTYGEGMSHSEIASVLDLSLGTVKSHVRRGLAALRERMREG